MSYKMRIAQEVVDECMNLYMQCPEAYSPETFLKLVSKFYALKIDLNRNFGFKAKVDIADVFI